MGGRANAVSSSLHADKYSCSFCLGTADLDAVSATTLLTSTSSCDSSENCMDMLFSYHFLDVPKKQTH